MSILSATDDTFKDGSDGKCISCVPRHNIKQEGKGKKE